MDDRQFSKELDSLQEYEKYYFEFRTNQLLDKYGRNSRMAQKEALQETIDLREIAIPISKEKRTWYDVYAEKLKMIGQRDTARTLTEERDKSKLSAMDVASAGLAVYGGPAGVAIDVIGKEMIGSESKIKKVGRAATEKIKDVKLSLEDYFTYWLNLSFYSESLIGTPKQKILTKLTFDDYGISILNKGCDYDSNLLNIKSPLNLLNNSLTFNTTKEIIDEESFNYKSFYGA